MSYELVFRRPKLYGGEHTAPEPTGASMPTFCELDPTETKIEVYFPYDEGKKNALRKAIPAARFVPRDKAGPAGAHWTVPLDLDAARKLRIIFGPALQLGNGVRAWGRDEASKIRNLGALTTADDYPVEQLALFNTHRQLAEYLRPYQRADVRMMALANILNCNQPGTGKTIEVLAAIEEAGLVNGPHLISAPVRSLENVWRLEIEKWMPGTVYTSEDPTERRAIVTGGLAAAARGETCWILVNPDMLRVRKLKPDSIEKSVRSDHKGNLYGARGDIGAEVLAIEWQSFTVDEFHKAGLNNHMSLFTLGTELIKAKRNYRLSGTPMGGKPFKLHAPLRSIEPAKFPNKWSWAEEWLEIETGYAGHKSIAGIRSGMEDKFYEAHARYLVRRLKREALPGLPPKQQIEVLCHMTTDQREQYEKFARDAEVRIQASQGDDSTLFVGDCILAEFTRLKQFANAHCVTNDKGQVVPTEDSGKLEHLIERLDEFGVRTVDPEPSARAIVASESKRMVEMVYAYLVKQGISCDMLTGDTKDSKPIISRFQDDTETPYVIVMTTQTGGVSLNLERAGSVHILDESWNPDNEEQLEDRGDRGSRTTSLMCLYYRTRGTIQQYIAEVAGDKKITNANVLDVYRQIKKRRAL